MSYQFRPIGKNCAATGEPLEAGADCHSVLVQREGKLVRLDYSEAGWTEAPGDAIGHWICEVPEPEIEKKKPLDPNALMSLFEQLSESPNPAQEKLQYVVALLLMRKRRLVLEATRDDGENKWMTVAATHGEGTFEIRDRELAEDEFLEIQQQLDSQTV